MYINRVHTDTLIQKALNKLFSSRSKRVVESIYSFWIVSGFSNYQACGWIAQADRESSFVSTALGDNGHTFGLFQLPEDRVALIRKGCDIDLASFPIPYLQCKAMLWELRNAEHGAFRSLAVTSNAYEAGYSLSKFYLRLNDENEHRRRGRIAEQWYDKLVTNYKGPGVA